MTGVERLRELAGGINCSVWACSDNFYCEAHDLTPYNNGGMMRVALEDIADQIEREQDKVAQMDWEAVREVAADMAGRTFMSATIDGLLCDWSRKLTSAADGHDHAADVSMSAYDLLPKEERDAIAWVRERGGLERVKKLLDWVVGHCSTRQQLDFDFWLSGRVMYELGFEEDMADRDEVERRLAARLMPDGMEWPKVDGKPVVIGERMRSCGIDDCKVVGIDPGNSRLILASDNIEEGKATYFTDFAEHCHRPAPKVLDADGVEIRVGDRVWSTQLDEPHEWIVIDPHGYRDDSQTVLVSIGDRTGHARPENLTHRAPVLAADGRPLRKGETVWYVESGTEYEVVGIHTDEDSPVRVMRTDGTHLAKATKPSQLTHAKPEIDTWQRIEEDAEKDPCSYFGFDGEETCGKCPASGKNCEQTMAQDLVRRCRALAERERGE